MKVIIANERHNPYLKRKEIIVNIEHEGEATPQKEALQQYLAKELNTEAEKIEVKSIFTDAGMPKSKAKIFAWEEKTVKQESKEEKKEEAKEGRKEAVQTPKEEAKQAGKAEQTAKEQHVEEA